MAWAPYFIQAASGGLTIATNTYVAGDQLGTEITLTGASLAAGASGAIVGVEMIDYSNVLGAVDMFLFYDSTSPAADNAACAWSDADSLKNIPGSPLMLPGPTSTTNNRTASLANVWIPYQTGASANLYCDLVTRSAHTYFGAVGDIKLNVVVMRFS